MGKGLASVAANRRKAVIALLCCGPPTKRVLASLLVLRSGDGCASACTLVRSGRLDAPLPSLSFLFLFFSHTKQAAILPYPTFVQSYGVISAAAEHLPLDLVVSDMNVSSSEASEDIWRMCRLLRPGGRIVQTIKSVRTYGKTLCVVSKINRLQTRGKRGGGLCMPPLEADE